MNILEEARYRLTCCIAKTGDGWGDHLSLRNHLNCSVGPRLHELKPFVEEIERRPDLLPGFDIVSLMYEYHDLVSIKRDIRNYVNPPLVEVEREPRHHVCPESGADLSSLVRLVDHGDFIHCSQEAYRELDTSTLFQASTNKITFIF